MKKTEKIIPTKMSIFHNPITGEFPDNHFFIEIGDETALILLERTALQIVKGEEKGMMDVILFAECGTGLYPVDTTVVPSNITLVWNVSFPALYMGIVWRSGELVPVEKINLRENVLEEYVYSAINACFGNFGCTELPQF